MGETPVPIPNTMVKTQAADGTVLETVWESRWLPDQNGGVAQLGEHLPCKQGVKSSNLSVSISGESLKDKRRSKRASRSNEYTYLVYPGLIAQPVRAHA